MHHHTHMGWGTGTAEGQKLTGAEENLLVRSLVENLKNLQSTVGCVYQMTG